MTQDVSASASIWEENKRPFGLISPPLGSVNKKRHRPTGEASPEVDRFASRLHVTFSPQNTGGVDPRRRRRAKLANLAN